MSNLPVENMSVRKRAGAARLGRLLLSLALLLGFSGCEDSPGAETPREAPSLRSSSGRIVSLSAPASRFVIELGAGDRLVGVDEESAALPSLGELPVVDLAAARALAPDLVLLSDLGDADPRAYSDLESDGVRLLEFAPHDLEEAGALSRGLGAQLVGVASASRFESRFSRPLALISGSSPPFDRLRVVAIVDLDPLTLAGGHSFETDLIEIGGGSSITHGRDDSRIVMTQALWEEFEPDLVILTTRDEASPLERRVARTMVPERFALEFFDYDRETFWLHGPEEEAERMRALIARASASRP